MKKVHVTLFYPDRTEQEKHVELRSNVPVPPPPPPLPRTSSLSYLNESNNNNNNIKKRNLTFNLDNNLEQEIEKTGNHHGGGSSGSCYHHFHVDEPTKTVELEPQPNNVNKVSISSTFTSSFF